MSTANESRVTLYRRLIVASILVGGIGASSAIALWARRSDASRADEEFERRVDSRHARFVEHFASQIESLYGLKLLFGGERAPSRRVFSEAAREILARHPSLTAVEWVPRIAKASRAAVEETATTELDRPFSVVEPEPGNSGRMADAGQRDEYYPILFAEPSVQNASVLGYDLKTGPTINLLERARTSGQLVTSGRVPLWQDAPRDRGLILVLPVFASPVPGEPRDVFKGFLQGVFILDNLLADTGTFSTSHAVETLFLDMNAETPEKRALFFIGNEIATSDPSQMPSIESFRGGADRERSMQLGGRDWQIVYRPAPDPENSDSLIPFALLGGGFLTTFLMAGYVTQSLRQSQRIRREVTERTSELRATKAELEMDIARRIQVERALAESETRYRAFIEQTREPTWRCELDVPLPLDPDVDVDLRVDHILKHGYLAECNRAMAQAYGYNEASEIANLRLNRMMDPNDAGNRAYLAALLSSTDTQLRDVESHGFDRFGKPRVFLKSLVGIVEKGRLVRAWGTQRDITERRQAEEEKRVLERRLLEAQKLESLGLLAGGIAHDFNNLLTGIVGNANLAAQDRNRDAASLGNLKDIEAAALRAAALCHQLLAYAGKGRFAVQRIDVRALIENTVPLLRPSLSKRATLQFSMPEGLPGVTADESQVSQIVMNLVINASEALGDKGGQISISCGSIAASAVPWNEAILAPENPTGTFVWVEVGDTGAGMSVETLAQIFEPFFTTKFAGRGLGLAAVLGTIRGHKGGLIVKSRFEAGSTFRFFLPASSDPVPAKKISPALPIETRYRGCAMIVDDEDPVRFVATRMLEICGFEVISSSDGVDAVERFQKLTESPVLVLLDLTMPRMGGVEVLGIMRKRYPQLPIVLMSGYSQRDAGTLLNDEKITGFLQKPYTFSQLKEQLDRLLG